MKPTKLTITPQLLLNALGAIITEAVAFGIVDNRLAQLIVGIGGIVIPAAFAVAQALHLGRVHAAVAAAAASNAPVKL